MAPEARPVHPIVFFGTEKFSLFGLQALINAGYPVAAVVTKPDMKKGRGKTLVSPEVKTLAQAHNIPVLQPQQLHEITAFITQLQPVVGVLVSFGRILPQTIIDLFEPGIINVHPSLLPRYRGPSPIETAILNDDSVTGVSIMQLSAQMDAGPVYVQETFNIEQFRQKLGIHFTKETLYTSLGELGAGLLVKALPAITQGTLSSTGQDEAHVSYCHLITKQDGIIDWTKPAPQIEREVIAYAGWPGSRTELGGIEVTITQGHAVEYTTPPHPSNQLLIEAGNDASGMPTLFRITRLKPAGKKELSDREFINGYGQLHI